MFHGVMPVQGGAHRPRLEEWHPFSAQVANDDDVDTNLSTSSSRNLTYITRLHTCATAIVQAHSRQRRRSSSPKEYICYTKLTRGAWMVITISLAACLLEFDQTLTAMRHTPCGRQAIASLNRARWGDNVYIPVHKGWVSAGCNNRRTQPHYWAKSDTYSKAPVSNRAHNTTNGILRFLMTCRAADFNDTGFVSSAVHQVDTWLPADFSAGTYQILTVTQHGYRHVITLKSAAFIREIAIKSLPLHYKPIANQSRTNQQCLP